MHLLIKIVQIFRKDDGTFLSRVLLLPVATTNIDNFQKNKKEIATREINLQWLLSYLTSTMPRFKGSNWTERSNIEILASSLKVITEPLKMEE